MSIHGDNRIGQDLPIKKSFKKVPIDPRPDTILKMKNCYKIAAATFVIEAIMQHMPEHIKHLNIKEQYKVTLEIDKIVDRIRTKRAKDHGII